VEKNKQEKMLLRYQMLWNSVFRPSSLSASGNTALTYACAGGYVDVVKVLLESGASIEDHNENGHTPLMEAGSAGHVEVARVLLENGAGINTHSNEFKESALTLACYKGTAPNTVLVRKVWEGVTGGRRLVKHVFIQPRCPEQKEFKG